MLFRSLSFSFLLFSKSHPNLIFVITYLLTMIVLIDFILLHMTFVHVIHIIRIQYVDSVGGGKYAFRVYVSENSGAILGANFMKEMNVIFDEGLYLNYPLLFSLSFLFSLALLCFLFLSFSSTPLFFPLSRSSHLLSSLT